MGGVPVVAYINWRQVVITYGFAVMAFLNLYGKPNASACTGQTNQTNDSNGIYRDKTERGASKHV